MAGEAASAPGQAVGQSSDRGSKHNSTGVCIHAQLLSRVRLCDPMSMGFSRREQWSGLPFPSPGDLPKPGTEPRSPALQADSLPPEPPGKPQYVFITFCLSVQLSMVLGFLSPLGYSE